MQFDLFAPQTPELPSCVGLQAAFLSAEQATALYQNLLSEIPWQQPAIVVYGQQHLIPRQQCWMGDVGYQYSGVYFQPEPWLPQLQELKCQLERVLGTKFNTCLLNYYRDGQDKMGWHADDEPELGKDPTIACLSLGAERCFSIKHRETGHNWQLDLPHGSLLLMKPGMQSQYLHALPVRKKVLAGRISLTFRQVFE